MKKVTVFVIVWMVFSIGYIAYDQWQGFKFSRVQVAYERGISDSVESLIEESKNCQPIPLYDGAKKVEVISVGCLDQIKP